MSDESAQQRLDSLGKDVGSVTTDLEMAKSFLETLQTLEGLPGIDECTYDSSHGRYRAVSSGQEIQELERVLKEFFGRPKTRAGEPMPQKLQGHPILGYIEGDPEAQSLFFKKSENGLFYGAIEPLAEPAGSAVVRIGFARKRAASAQAPAEAPADTMTLEAHEIGLAAKTIDERMAEQLDEGSGLVNGVGLATFLRESEIEQSSCTLKVTSGDQSGYLFIRDGVLIDAIADSKRGRIAAEEIVSWTDTEIEIQMPGEKEEDTIGQPLLRTLTAAMQRRKKRMNGPDSGEPSAEGEADAESEEAPSEEEEEPSGKGGKKKKAKKAKKAKKGKKKKKGKKGKGLKIKPLHAAAVVLVLVLAAGGWFGWGYWKGMQREKALNAVLAKSEAESDVPSAVAHLKSFVSAGPKDEYTARAAEKIRQLQAADERRLRSQILAQVQQVAMGPDYEKNAAGMYRQYLDKYPDGRYAKEMKKRIADLPKQIESFYYQQVTEAESRTAAEKLAAIGAYREYVPESVQREEIRNLLEQLMGKQLRELEVETARCDQQGDWRPCLALCDEFTALFGAAGPAGQSVLQLREEMAIRQDQADLQGLTVRHANEPIKLQEALQRFLTERPDTSEREKIQAQLVSLESAIAESRKWQQAASIARDERRNYSVRIEAVEDYLAGAAGTEYRQEALSLKRELEKQQRAEIKRQQAATIQAAREAALAKKKAAEAREKLRLQGLYRQIGSMLRATQGRFVDKGDGTFVDTRTGLMWCLLDSQRELQGCRNYKAARKYVQSITTGGHRDWRFPNAAELASLYKNAPYFPDSAAPWYWTSRLFTTGYHEKVQVVTTERKMEYKPQYRRTTECGSVRAVRNVK